MQRDLQTFMLHNVHHKHCLFKYASQCAAKKHCLEGFGFAKALFNSYGEY